VGSSDAARYRCRTPHGTPASLLPGGRAPSSAANPLRPRRSPPSSRRAQRCFGQLAANDDWFVHRGSPAPVTDITDGDGVVYRYFADAGSSSTRLATSWR
jgi:hypothetical protein